MIVFHTPNFRGVFICKRNYQSNFHIPLGVGKRITNGTKRVRTFNTTGVCNPDQHYMIDLAERLAQVDLRS